jgi:Ankyrin repeats (3 copies)
MKRLNHLELLDENLRLMPKPTLGKDKHLQIKNSILNTRTSQIKQKKNWNYKGMMTTIGALAAAFMFAVLLYGYLGQNSEPSTMVLSSMIEGDIRKISGSTNGHTYQSEDEMLIKQFYEDIGNMKFMETEEENTKQQDTITLYNANGKLLKTFNFGTEDIVTIDGNQYTFDMGKWENFKEIFFTDKYRLPGNDNEDSGEQSGDTKDISLLMDQELAKAPSQRDWNKVLDYVKQGASPDRALLLAAKENNVAIVPELLNLKANPNTTDGDSNTPLMLTTSIEVASSLIDHGADPIARNKRGHNPLVIAVYGHHTEMVKLLLEAGADPNTTVQPESSVSVLWMAGKYGDQSISELLIEHGADEVEGYDQESWWIAQIPSLSNMLNQKEELLSSAQIGRLPGIPYIQIPADSNVFSGQKGDPFETLPVKGGTVDVYGDHIYYKPEGKTLYTAYQYELNPGDHVTVAEIEDVMGVPSSTTTKDSGLEGMVYSLDQYELTFYYDGTLSYPKNELDILSLELVYKEPGIIEQAESVFTLLADKNMKELAKQVHPEKGVLFAPYLQLKSTSMTETHNPVTFSTKEIPNLLQDKETYLWGYGGGSGLPIEMTPSEYFEGYVHTKQQPDAIYVNEQNLTGPEFFTETVRGIFPSAHMVQYSFFETQKGYDQSWLQLTLVFEEYEGEWKLVGVLHNAWTP